MALTRFIILLRAVNVGASRKLIMADLRAEAAARGLVDVQTYIQSGNLLVSSDEDAIGVERGIETLIAERFGLKAIAIARTADEFARIADARPFPDAVPKMLHLGLTKRPVLDSAIASLEARRAPEERLAIAGGELWIDYGGGVGTSRLTPSVLDKAAGSTLTARNLNTVLTLVEMARA